MRLNTKRIHQMATIVVERLVAQGLLQIQGKPEPIVKHLEAAITNELEVEDRLNADVREMLKQFDEEFTSGRADYQKMFSMLKKKLIKERDIVL